MPQNNELIPQPRPVVITVFTHVVPLQALPHFSKSPKQNKAHVKLLFAIGGAIGLVDGII